MLILIFILHNILGYHSFYAIILVDNLCFNIIPRYSTITMKFLSKLLQIWPPKTSPKTLKRYYHIISKSFANKENKTISTSTEKNERCSDSPKQTICYSKFKQIPCTETKPTQSKMLT